MVSMTLIDRNELAEAYVIQIMNYIVVTGARFVISYSKIDHFFENRYRLMVKKAIYLLLFLLFI